MLIPRTTSFNVRCRKHGCTVEGALRMKHPSSTATAVWTFDFSMMNCPERPLTSNACKSTWEVRA